MSGKSTYLKQIGLLTVQAMIGCLWVEDSNTISLHELTGPLLTFSVPAEYACFILHDSLLSRLSNDGKEQANIIVWLHLLKVVDSMEKCLSTFASEMAASAMILGESHFTDRLLIVRARKS